MPKDQTSTDEIDTIFSELQTDAQQRLSFAAMDGNALRVSRTLGQRYLGQRYELPVRVDDGPLRLQRVAHSFHAEHQRMYGYARPDEPVELASVWLSVEVDLQTVELPEAPAASNKPQSLMTRQVIFAGQSHETGIYQRRDFGAGAAMQGPAIIEQLDATTILWPGQKLEVDRFGQLLLGPMESV